MASDQHFSLMFGGRFLAPSRIALHAAPKSTGVEIAVRVAVGTKVSVKVRVGVGVEVIDFYLSLSRCPASHS